GFVNAVLRALAAGRQNISLPDPAQDLAGHLAVAQSHPRWLVERWLAELGPEETVRRLEADNSPPGLTLRAYTPAGGRAALLARLKEAGLEAEPGLYSPQAILVKGVSVAQLEKLAPGQFVAQSEASQLVALVLAPEPGWRVADMCAGVGGKTGHLAELMAGQGQIVALEKDPDRARAGQEAMTRLGLKGVEFFQADAFDPDLEMLAKGPLEAVLIDAPCTCSGVLRSRPDVRWRLKPDDPGRMSLVQRALLRAGAERLGPSGALVYATCSLFEEENQEVVAGFLAERPEFEVQDPSPWLPPGLRPLVDSQGFVITRPEGHGLDGFFVARLVKTAARP
ncbi:MAG: 16S rRNA (cytosine(967)-C(5))-methyltransferase RsmB, partial [Deltaproteobacteria bacterium]|nr:16S rRNA (cytosine(967)-C(5))-methyltransferase RsmB [Deltaproteobacteria bacterium]